MRKFWIATATVLTLAGVPTAAFAATPLHPVAPAGPTNPGAGPTNTATGSTDHSGAPTGSTGSNGSTSTGSTGSTDHPGKPTGQPGPTNHPGKPTTLPSKANPTVMFVLRATVATYSAYTPATSGSTAVNGTISITVVGSNFDRATLKGATLSFTIDNKTKVVLHDHLAIASGDRVIVNLRAAKDTKLVTAEAASPPVSFSAFQVIDQGSNS